MSLYIFILLFIVVPGGIAWVLQSTLRATLVSVAVVSAAWAWIAASAYQSPIPVNEPEWWGGLAISCTLAAIGLLIGAAARARFPQPKNEPITPRA